MVGCYYYVRSYGLDKFVKLKLTEFPRVAVVVPTRNEDEEMVARNMESLSRMDYPHDLLSFTLLDNSTKPSERLKSHAEILGWNYVFMKNPVKLKAYVMNEFMKSIPEEYVAVFDADENLDRPEFLKETLPYISGKGNESVALVQTIKEFAPASFFANAVNVYYLFFYRFIQPVRNLAGSTMYTGSCAIVRRSVVLKVGGFPYSPTEDLAFALKADIAGHPGRYVYKRYAFGAPIESFSDFASQQWRYTIGNIWGLYDYLSNLGKFSPIKHLHYWNLFGYIYLSMLFVLYAILTLSFVLYDIGMRSINSQVMMPWQLQLMGFSYIIAIVILVVVGGKLYFGSFRAGIMSFFLNFSVAILRSRAIVLAFLRRTTGFNFTMTRQSAKNLSLLGALKATWLETAFGLLLLGFSVLSFLRSDPLSAFWLFWYSWLFFCALLFTVATDVKRKGGAKPGGA
ncbi:Glycosyltransferase like family 2 [uncultured archaeon]|nr:Glycosyltransferase like family 2 [uncultured archaeon]